MFLCSIATLLLSILFCLTGLSFPEIISGYAGSAESPLIPSGIAGVSKIVTGRMIFLSPNQRAPTTERILD